MRALPVAGDSSTFGSSKAFAAHLTEGRRLLSLAPERCELEDGWAMHLPGDDATVLAIAHCAGLPQPTGHPPGSPGSCAARQS
jgi:hypothetical protein